MYVTSVNHHYLSYDERQREAQKFSLAATALASVERELPTLERLTRRLAASTVQPTRAAAAYSQIRAVNAKRRARRAAVSMAAVRKAPSPRWHPSMRQVFK